MDNISSVNMNMNLPGTGRDDRALPEEPVSLHDADQVTLSRGDGKERLFGAEKVDKAPPAPVSTSARQVVFADCAGQITHLGIQVDGEVVCDANKGREVFNTVKTLFSKMEPDTKFTILVERDKDKAAIQKIMKDIKMPNPDRVHLLMAPYNITSWMRDNLVMTFKSDDPHHPIMVDKVPFQSHDDPGLPKFIADNTEGIVYSKDRILRTDGGDVVSDAKKAYVGYDSIYLTAMNLYKESQAGKGSVNLMMKGMAPLAMESPAFSKKIVFDDVPAHSHLPKFHLEDNPQYAPVKGPKIEDAWLQKSMEYFKGRYGKDIVMMGDDDPDTAAVEKPATFHIDMGVTPINDDTVLVGSPAMAIEEIGKWSKDKYNAANKSLQQETGLRGDILKNILRHNREEDPDDSSVMRIQNNFESQVKRLESLGKNIIRLPYLEGDRYSASPWITYGNCIQQDFSRPDGTHVKNVFLPVYGIPLDEVATKTYESQGFEVIPLPLAAFTSLAGAIRCMSNYLGRTPAA
jgi:hypothetical protein